MKCAATALSSKLIARQKEFFSEMVVNAVSLLDDMLPMNMIGTKKVTGGSLEVRHMTGETVYTNLLLGVPADSGCGFQKDLLLCWL